MNSKLLKIIFGVAGVGFLMKIAFGAVVFASIQSFLAAEDARWATPKETKFVAGGPVELPDLSDYDDLSQPLLLRERAMASLKVHGILGYGSDGWALRYNTKKDAIALRPDLANCIKVPLQECHTASKRHRDAVFFKGNKRLYVHLNYTHSNLFRAFDRDEATALKRDHTYSNWSLARPNRGGVEYLKKDWEDLEPWNGFSLRRLANHGGKGAYFLKATLEGAGKVDIHMMTNAPLDDVKAQLSAMNLDLLHALVAPVPFGGYDTQKAQIDAVLEDRQDRDLFDVLSDDALRAKVTAMAPEQRIKYTKKIIDHALHHQNSPLDYDIIYHPAGALGLQDTRDFIADLIANDDVRYAHLRKEHQKNLPIGSCVTTKLGVHCRAEAEFIRIANEIRRQSAHARAAQPVTPDADLPAYSEATFRAEMRSLERQMENTMQRLIAFRAGQDVPKSVAD